MKQASIRTFFGTPAPAKPAKSAAAGASWPHEPAPGGAAASAAPPPNGPAAPAKRARGADGATAEPAEPPLKAPSLAPAPPAGATAVPTPSFLRYASPSEPPLAPQPPLAAADAPARGATPAGGLATQQRLHAEANRQAALARRAQRERELAAAHPPSAGVARAEPPAARAPARASAAAAAEPSVGGRRRRLVKYAERSEDEDEAGRGEPSKPARAPRARARTDAAAAASDGDGDNDKSSASDGAPPSHALSSSGDDDDDAGASGGESDGASDSDAPRKRKRTPAPKGGGARAAARARARPAAAPPARARARGGAAAAAAGAAADGGGGGGGGGAGGGEESAAAGGASPCWEGTPPPFLVDPTDRAGVRPGEAGHDGRTLRVTDAELARLSPGMEQYWRIKRNNMDCVLCFKVGKFYELFEDDAHLVHRELELNYMGKARPHAGFPEAALPKYAEQLVARGYRLAVVEQMETPAQLAERNRLAKVANPRAKAERAVRREVCSLLSPGTLTSASLAGPEARWLLALTMREPTAADPPGCAGAFGACLVDAAASRFVVGSFADGPTLGRLRTLLAEAAPAEALLDADRLPAAAALVVALAVRERCISRVRGADAFPSADTAAAELDANGYFDAELGGCAGGAWPEPIAHFRPARERELAGAARGVVAAAAAADGARVDELGMRALGGGVRYLARLLLARELLSLGELSTLPPPGGGGAWDARAAAGGLGGGRAMLLDAQALANLEVLRNSADGGRRGTLLDALDRTCTLWGARALRGWLCRPLVDVAAIEARQEAIDCLIDAERELRPCRASLRRLPDLERLLARIHALSIARADDGATFYANVAAARVRELVATLRGLRDLDAAVREHLAPLLDAGELRGPLLAHCCSPDVGYPAGVADALRELAAEFDWERAASSGRVVPAPGVCARYDGAVAAQADAERVAEAERAAVEELLGLRAGSVTFFHGGVGKETHQLELPVPAIERYEARGKRQLPAEWVLMSARAGFKRFWTPALRDAVSRIDAAKADAEGALGAEHRALFRRFASRHALWAQAVRCVGDFDCLQSLAAACASLPGLTRPKVVARGDATGGRPLLRVRGGFHLLAAAAAPSASAFVANDLALGGPRDGSCGADDAGGDAADEPVVAIVTGPNMGGKSTLLRQSALLVMMAQLGCHVPAAHAELTPADAIFTRVGAADRILAGQSTFRVELEETSAILSNASADSLVILDELGRGTATFDGMAIAHAVLRRLVDTVGCRTLFATHYHLLAEEHETSASASGRGGRGASVHRMACRVDEQTREVTFLYRFERGACLRSHGVNVARLAGLPAPLLASAAERSAKLERVTSAARPAGARAARTRARAAEIARQVAAAAAALASAAQAEERDACARELLALQAEARALLGAAAGDAP